MKPYRAIIWVSFLLIVGEGIVLSGLNFVPVAREGGVVLGETTSAAFGEIATIQYPASYYTPESFERIVLAETGEEAVLEETVAISEGSASAPEESATPTEKGEQPQVDRLVEVLNTPAFGETLQEAGEIRDDETAEPRVSELMQKNERLYRERLIKELEQVRKDLESFRDGLDGA